MKTHLILLLAFLLPATLLAQGKKIMVGNNISAYVILDNEKGVVRAYVAGPGDTTELDLQKPAAGPRRVKIADFNFDGLKDFAVTSKAEGEGEGAPELCEIFLYNPESREFQPLEVPSDGSNCDQLYNVKPIAASKQLISSCRSQGAKRQTVVYKYTDAFTIELEHAVGGQEIEAKEEKEPREKPEKKDKPEKEEKEDKDDN